MPETKFKSEFKDLFDLAKTRKYLTYDEINKHIPPEMVGEAQIDELLMKIVTEFNVELVPFDKKVPVTDPKARDIDLSLIHI